MNAGHAGTTTQRREIVIGASLAMIAAGLLVALIAGSWTYGAASAAGTSPPAPRSEQRSERGGQMTAVVEPVSDDTIVLVKAGIARSLPNGSEVPVSGGLLATLTLSPGMDRHSRQLDVYLHDAQASRSAIDDATVQVTARMRYMDHGTFQQIATVTGDGHYVLPLTFPMPGEWELGLQLDDPRDHGNLTMNLDLFD